MITETQTRVIVLQLTDELRTQLQPFMAGLDITATATQCLTMRAEVYEALAERVGSALDYDIHTVDAVLNYTASMTWRGLHPVVELVTTVYQTGVRLTKAAMAEIEAQIARQPGLDKWFVDILPNACRDD